MDGYYDYKFTDKQYEYIKKELGIDKETLDKAMQEGNDELLDKLYDDLCEIEINGIPASNKPIPEHVQTAIDIVTLMSQNYKGNE